MMFEMFTQLYRNYFKSGANTKEDPTKIIPSSSTDQKQSGKLEKQLSTLTEENRKLRGQLEYSRSKEADLHKVLANYDDLLKKVVTEKTELCEKQEKTQLHLANLENAFYDLLQKYEKAKQVLLHFQQNEQVLKKRLDEYETVMEFLKNRNHENRTKPINNKKSDTETNKKRRLLTTIS